MLVKTGLFIVFYLLNLMHVDVSCALDWNDFLGPDRNGKSQEKINIVPWGKTGPKIVWVREIGTSYGSPTVANGRVYVFARHADLARLSCLESTTGDEIWKYEYPSDYEDMYGYNNGPRCCPVVDGDRVYIFGAEGELHCVSTHDGKPLWKVDTVDRFNVVQNFFGVSSVPAVEGELLIVHIGGLHKEHPETSGTLMVSQNRMDLELLHSINGLGKSYIRLQMN